jgi:hypothetical protein
MSAVETAEIVGAAVAVITLAGPVQSFFRRTLGRKWDLYTRLYRLGAGAQLDFFIAVIGEPPALRDTVEVDIRYSSTARALEDDPPSAKQRFLRSTFVDPLFYVVTISDEDEAVLGFSITTRRRRFTPTFYAPRAPSFRRRVVGRLPFVPLESYWLVRFRLGRTTFSKAASNLEGTPRIHSSIGGRA